MEDFSLYNKISSPIVVLKKGYDILFFNDTFKKYFGEKNDLKRLKNQFNLEVCVLYSDDFSNMTPIDLAINSKESFHTFASFQKDSDVILYFLIDAFYVENHKIIVFNDITQKVLYGELEEENQKLKTEIKEIEEENQKFLEIKQKAQNQAIKMALLNRISNSIRQSTDFEKTLESASKELYSLLGGYKLQYVKYKDDTFEIEYSYPQTYSEENLTKVTFDLTTKNDIFNKKILYSPVLSEYKNSKEKLKSSISRVVIPIHHSNHLFGTIVVFTKNKLIDESLFEVLEAISAQLASAIVQAFLFQRLNIQNSELENTLKELKATQLQLINTEKMASLGQLIAGVAHEINTPLASINSNNSILKKFADKINSDIATLEMYKNIINTDELAIKRISNIVKSLKKFVRLDESELQKADINNELDLTLTLLEHETKNRIEIEKKYSKLPEINCYPNMLNQVFMNILVNAIQSIENTGKIVISTKIEHNNLKIIFEDSGCGMDEKTVQNIFLPGFTTKGVGVGTGLGLAISQKIIEKHKGKIEVFSKISEGTKFVISLPLS